MWKYVSRRVKDTIDLGINVRKSFTVQQFNLNQNLHEQQQQQQHVRKQNQHHLNYELASQYHDPSRDKGRSDEKFKRRYYRLNNNSRCFLNALTWSTAIITGFYTSQLLCLYRRNQRLGNEVGRCYYSKYLQNTTKSIHKNVKYLLTAEGQDAILSAFPKFECPFQSKFQENRKTRHRRARRTVEDEFIDFKHFVDPGYKQYERFFEADKEFKSSTNVYNVGNDKLTEPVRRLSNDSFAEPKRKVEETKEDRENAAIDDAILRLAHIVGELEFQMGIESFSAGDFNEAVTHFRLSTNHNHPGGIFNLALCYEQGVGVTKNLKTAKKLYEIASDLGHAKAFYNLGVYAAQGLGGAQKSATAAKGYFKKAADLGSPDAIKALNLLIPPPKKLKLPVQIEEFQVDEVFSSDKSMITHAIMSQNLQKMMQVSVY